MEGRSLLAPKSLPAWWRRPGLEVCHDELTIAGRSALRLVAAHGSPLFVYDLDRLEDNFARLHGALNRARPGSRVFYAMKANRFGPLLRTLARRPEAGIDTASPGEVRSALAHSFGPERITFTNVSVSRRDLAGLVGLPIMLNCDSLSMIDKVADLDPGRPIGLRINPQVGVGISENLIYAGGARATKFGIYLDQIEAAVAKIADRGLELEGLHMHVGCGWTGSAITQFFRAADRLFQIAAEIAHRYGPLRYINVGGGLGVPLKEGDGAVNVELYARGLAERARALGPGTTLCVEPGDYLVKDCAVMLAEATMCEEKGGVRFVGLDTGFHVHCGASHYGLYQEFVRARAPHEECAEKVTIVGNINEVVDVFAHDRAMPPIEEGECLAMLNAGGYGTSMTSAHCLREPAKEIALSRRANPWATA